LWGRINHICSRMGQATPAHFRIGVQVFGSVLEVVLVIGLLLISAIWLAGGTYNPFIYYRF
jgi:alginate O-acetyltransferase complex protein AlgI